jgi:hypothetical protein
MPYIVLPLLALLFLAARRLSRVESQHDALYTRTNTLGRCQPYEDGPGSHAHARELLVLDPKREPGCPTGTCHAGDPECQHGFGQNHWQDDADLLRNEEAMLTEPVATPVCTFCHSVGEMLVWHQSKPYCDEHCCDQAALGEGA